MRTTISLDDQLAQTVRREARARSMSVSAFVSGILADALQLKHQASTAPFKLPTIAGVAGVRLRSGIDLDQPRALEILDEEKEFLKSSHGSP